MKSNKAIYFLLLLITIVNANYCQIVTKNEKIHWNTLPDSLTLFYPLFENSVFDDNWNFHVYSKNYNLGDDFKNIDYTVSLNNVIYDNVSPQETDFLNSRISKVPDTLYYRLYNQSSKGKNYATLFIFPYISENGVYKKVTSYTVQFSKQYNFNKVKNEKNKISYSKNSVLGKGRWYKITIGTTGIHKISASDLISKGIDVSNISTSQLAIYGNGGGALSENNSDFEYNDIIENSIYVNDINNNGIFDGNDYLLFYAEAANVWKYNIQSSRYEYQVHPYSVYNYYYLSLDAFNSSNKRISISESTQDSPTQTISTYNSYAVINNDLINTHNTGRIWVGEKFSNITPSRSFTLKLPNMVIGSDIHLKYALASISTKRTSFIVNINGSSKTHPFYRYPYEGWFSVVTANNTSECVLNIAYQYEENMASGYLDYIEANATSALTFNADQMRFSDFKNVEFNTTSEFVLSNTNSNIRIWDVTDPCNVEEMKTSFNNGKTTFKQTMNKVREFRAFNGKSFYSPLAMTALSNQNLHSLNQQDYIIVANPLYFSQAERLANIHRIYSGLDVVVVTPEQIYNEFSSGKQDAMAIRRFMKMFYDRAKEDPILKAPKYLLLFGKAVFDNKNITQSNIAGVVSYQSLQSFDDDGGSFTSDDLFGYLDDEESGSIYEDLDIGIGRLPVKDLTEATTMVDKIENYITKRDLTTKTNKGDWRNYITFLADDADPGMAPDTYFVTSSEKTTASITKKYPQYNIEKIYADSYIQQSSAIGSFYPDVNNALKKRMNYGCLLLNYVGHGSTQYIGTERYMEISDIVGYTNTYQLPFFIASTCSFGKYDQPDVISGGESFILTPNGGGIAIATAGRPIGHSPTFNTELCINILDPNNSIGDAFRMAKNEANMTHSMLLMGDPALKLSIPENKVVVTAINNKPIGDDSVSDTATVLSKVFIEGEIRNASNTLLTDYMGEIYPIVFDRVMTYKTLANDNEGSEVEFIQQKNVLYKGRDSIRNGKFQYSFIVPRDVAYQYDYGKLSHYARSGNEDASGVYQNILFGGFNEDVNLVETRPEIRLFMNDSLFMSGGITDENPSIFAILTDSIGINAVGSGIGHDITAILDNKTNEIFILNDYYETDMYNPRKGYVLYPLSNLEEGTHTLTLKAWNIFNYSASKTITFTVRKQNNFSIGKFYNYPNPSHLKTYFRLEHNQPDAIASIEIKIFDMMGHFVKQINPPVIQGSYSLVPIEWNFDSNSGAQIASGIYIAHAIITATDGKQYRSQTKVVRLKK